jgi:hypothetical protein
LSSVTVLFWTPVAGLVTTRATFGMTPPLGSLTVPEILPVIAADTIAGSNNRKKVRINDLLMTLATMSRNPWAEEVKAG